MYIIFRNAFFGTLNQSNEAIRLKCKGWIHCLWHFGSNSGNRTRFKIIGDEWQCQQFPLVLALNIDINPTFKLSFKIYQTSVHGLPYYTAFIETGVVFNNSSTNLNFDTSSATDCFAKLSAMLVSYLFAFYTIVFLIELHIWRIIHLDLYNIAL